MTTDNWTSPKRSFQSRKRKFKAKEVPKWQRMLRHSGARKLKPVSLQKTKP